MSSDNIYVTVPDSDQYLSMQVVDQNHQTDPMIYGGERHKIVSSLDQGFITNLDGSVDIYFIPKAPKGKEANWAPTIADVDYFLLFRFYGPTEAFDQKTWVLGDLIKQ